MTEAEALALVETLPDAEPTAAPASESIARGALQGATLGFGDEASAALAATFPALDREAAQGDTWQRRFRAAQAFYRMKNREAQRANEVAYGGGEFGGAVASSVLAPVRGIGGLAALGAASGAGHSTSDEGLGVLKDAATGAALSAGIGGTFALAGKGLKHAGSKLIDRGVRKAEAEAESKVEDAIASARGAYGSARQQESRFIENLLRAEASGTLTPENAALLAELKASPRWAEALNQTARNAMHDLPDAMTAQALRRAEFEALAGDVERNITDEALRLLGPKEAVRLARERANRYLWAAGLGGVLGTMVGDFGWATAGGAGAALGLRPTLRAFARLADKPSWLVREGGALESLGAAFQAPVAAPRAMHGLHLTERGAPPELTEEELWRLIDAAPDAE